MRLRQGDSEREIARSGLQKTADHTLQESGLLWDGKTCQSRWPGCGRGRSAGGVAIIVGDVNLELLAFAVIRLAVRFGQQRVDKLPYDGQSR